MILGRSNIYLYLIEANCAAGEIFYDSYCERTIMRVGVTFYPPLYTLPPLYTIPPFIHEKFYPPPLKNFPARVSPPLYKGGGEKV